MRVLASLSCLSLLGVRHLLCDPVRLPVSTFPLTTHARYNFSHLPRLHHYSSVRLHGVRHVHSACPVVTPFPSRSASIDVQGYRRNRRCAAIKVLITVPFSVP